MRSPRCRAAARLMCSCLPSVLLKRAAKPGSTPRLREQLARATVAGAGELLRALRSFAARAAGEGDLAQGHDRRGARSADGARGGFEELLARAVSRPPSARRSCRRNCARHGEVQAPSFEARASPSHLRMTALASNHALPPSGGHRKHLCSGRKEYAHVRRFLQAFQSGAGGARSRQGARLGRDQPRRHRPEAGNLSLADLRREFTCKSDILRAFQTEVDAEVLAKAKVAGEAAKPARPAVRCRS